MPAKKMKAKASRKKSTKRAGLPYTDPNCEKKKKKKK